MIRVSGDVSRLLEKVLGCSVLTNKCRFTVSNSPGGEFCTILVLLPTQSDLDEAESCYSYLETMSQKLSYLTRVEVEKISHSLLKIVSSINNYKDILEVVQVLIEDGPWKIMVPSIITNNFLAVGILIMDFSFFVEKEFDILVMDSVNRRAINKLRKSDCKFSHVLFMDYNGSVQLRKSKSMREVSVLNFNRLSSIEMMMQLLEVDKTFKTKDLSSSKQEWLDLRKEDNTTADRKVLSKNPILALLPWFNPLKTVARKSAKQSSAIVKRKAEPTVTTYISSSVLEEEDKYFLPGGLIDDE